MAEAAAAPSRDGGRTRRQTDEQPRAENAGGQQPTWQTTTPAELPIAWMPASSATTTPPMISEQHGYHGSWGPLNQDSNQSPFQSPRQQQIGGGGGRLPRMNNSPQGKLYSPPTGGGDHKQLGLPSPGLVTARTSASSTPLFASFREGSHGRIDDSTSNVPWQQQQQQQQQPLAGGLGTYDAEPGYGYGPPRDGLARFLQSFYGNWLPHYRMYAFLVGGILFAVGHHVFYTTLDGHLALNQLKHLRYGATLAFLSKACLAAAAISAFRQRVWMTVRHKVLSLGAVDSLFAAADDLTSVFNVEVFRHAKLAMVLALYVWMTPFVVILTSDTLAVAPTTVQVEELCPGVRTLNFTHEAEKDWKVAVYRDKLRKVSVSVWNISAPLDTEHFDYWDGTSKQFELVVTLSAFTKQPLVRENASVETCGVGWNCSSTIKFTGPGYKCTELASGYGSRPRKLGKYGAECPFGTDILAPEGDFTYFARANDGDYANPQMESGNQGIPLQPPPLPRNLGALRTEPVIWVGYAAADDPSKPQEGDRTQPGWNSTYTPKIFGCEHWETEYQVKISYDGGIQTTKVLDRKFVKPVIDTTLGTPGGGGGGGGGDGTLDNTTATPEKNYILASGDVKRYRLAAAYHSIGFQLRNYVSGSIKEPNNVAEGKVIQTKLIDPQSYLARGDPMENVQSMYEDILLSMFANPQFIPVSWAAKPYQMTGQVLGGNDTLYPCHKERTDNRYRYHVSDLWGVYSVAIVLACCAVAAGVLAVWDQGVMRDMRFSSIAAATRGSALEKLPWGLEGPAPDTKHFKVGYGIVTGRGPPGSVDPGSYGFGLAGEVMQTQQQSRRQTFRFRSSSSLLLQPQRHELVDNYPPSYPGT